MTSIPDKKCQVIDCQKPYKGGGYCGTHWMRVKRHGNPHIQTRQYHGMNRSPEHVAWKAMKQRCYYKPNKEYASYGGRGIKVCDEWVKDFQAFFDYVGEKPTPKHTLDRIDNDKNYEPGNVRWANRITQMNNTSRNKNITYKNQTKTLPDWCRHLRIPYKKVYDRIYKLNWSVEKAFTKE